MSSSTGHSLARALPKLPLPINQLVYKGKRRLPPPLLAYQSFGTLAENAFGAEFTFCDVTNGNQLTARGGIGIRFLRRCIAAA